VLLEERVIGCCCSLGDLKGKINRLGSKVIICPNNEKNKQTCDAL
jgi:hypothetical protein